MPTDSEIRKKKAISLPRNTKTFDFENLIAPAPYQLMLLSNVDL